LLSSPISAKEPAITLNEAVKQVKSEGRILSAKTVNGKHEIKVLTPKGTVKTYNKKATDAGTPVKPDNPSYNRSGRGVSEYRKKSDIANKSHSQQRFRESDSIKQSQQMVNSKSRTTRKKDR